MKMATSTATLRLVIKLVSIFCIKKPTFASSNSICYSFYREEVADLDQRYIFPSVWFQQQLWNLKVRPKVSLQLLLLLSGDIETCPGPSQDRKVPELEKLTKVKGLKYFHLNVRGLWNNFSHITEILESYQNIDIFSLSESHIRDEPEEFFEIKNYTFISSPRKNGIGGGIATSGFELTV